MLITWEEVIIVVLTFITSDRVSFASQQESFSVVVVVVVLAFTT